MDCTELIKLEDFEFNKLKEEAKKFNSVGLLDMPLKTVGIKKAVLAEAFIEAVEGVDETKEDEIPDTVVVLYNTYMNFLNGETTDLSSTVVNLDNEDDTDEGIEDGTGEGTEDDDIGEGIEDDTGEGTEDDDIGEGIEDENEDDDDTNKGTEDDTGEGTEDDGTKDDDEELDDDDEGKGVKKKSKKKSTKKSTKETKPEKVKKTNKGRKAGFVGANYLSITDLDDLKKAIKKADTSVTMTVIDKEVAKGTTIKKVVAVGKKVGEERGQPAFGKWSFLRHVINRRSTTHGWVIDIDKNENIKLTGVKPVKKKKK